MQKLQGDSKDELSPRTLSSTPQGCWDKDTADRWAGAGGKYQRPAKWQPRGEPCWITRACTSPTQCKAIYVLAKNYIDTRSHKAGVPHFPGCMEHSGMILDQIQTTTHSSWKRKDLVISEVVKIEEENYEIQYLSHSLELSPRVWHIRDIPTETSTQWMSQDSWGHRLQAKEGF